MLADEQIDARRKWWQAKIDKAIAPLSEELEFWRSEVALCDQAKAAKVFCMERDHAKAQYMSVIKHLSHIHMLMHSEDVVADGKRFHFHPPEALVRETWEGFSQAIRQIPKIIADAEAMRGEAR